MNPITHSSRSLTALGAILATTHSALAYTVEIDPAGAIPVEYSEVYSVNWDTDGDLEGWAASGQFTLDPGTPTGGQIQGTTTGGDPNVNINGLNIESGFDTIIEVAVTKAIADTSRLDIFWGDANGGISGDRRLTSAEPWASSSDGLPHVIRFTFEGEASGAFTQFRYDFTAATGQATSLDYLRVYTIPSPDPLEWDPTLSGGVALGGTGTWDTNTTSNFWDGSSQVPWPASSTGLDEASFGGTPGVVTVDGGGVTTNVLTAIAGYEFTGGTITFDGNIPDINATGAVFSAPFDITSPQALSINGANNTFAASNTFSGDIFLNGAQTNLAADDALGTGTLTTKGGNIWFAAIDSDRFVGNQIAYRGNRLIIASAAFGGYPSSSIGNVIFTEDFDYSPTATPGDIFLRRDMEIDGVLSGSGIGGNALRFAGDSGNFTLNNPANTFGGGANDAIRIENGSFIEIVADGSLGDPLNYFLKAAGGNGGLRVLDSMTVDRDVVINGNTVFVLDTNGFDTTLSGFVDGQTTNNSRFYKRGAGRLIMNAPGINKLGGGLQIEEGTLEIAPGTTVNHNPSQWGASPGQFAGTTVELTGGEFIVGYWGLSRDGAGTSTFTLDSGNYVNTLEFLTAVNGDGVVNFNGGTADLNQFSLANGAGRTSTLNLNGTDFSLNFFNDRGAVGDEGDCVINFNGSTITAESNRDTDRGFIESVTTNVTCNVQAGGAIFDSAGFDLLIVPALIHDPALGATLDGGLTKEGEGNILLAGANTYTGDTNVDAGCLNLDNITAIPDLTKVNVAAGAGFGGIAGAGNLLDADIQSIVDTVNWDVGGGSFLVIDTNGADVTVAANITGDIGLIKKGDGVLTLTGTNTFTGSTVIEGGSIVTPGGEVSVDSITTGPGTNSGLKVTLAFTADSDVDIYASDDLVNWTPIATNVAASPYEEDDVADTKRFYVVVTAGETFPPAP
ncbi:autotransporter-associated beta strand repeat-containing protein [Haloferula rosea]|uniref:autotransporter-associated beta strand repeat-containing protein n=1 Tax=Haloferula rosea TaxID=490093 RepID=UPI002D7E91CC|nr:autotransporter-associated beta strand repeat-containing protein [Haloferula rosea]